MTLELIISQPQTQITGNPECDNIQNVPWIQANIQFLNTIKGVGISNIEKTSTVGLIDTYTITYTDGTTSTFDVTNGIVGRGIVSILKTSTQELTDTYTITYTDETTSTFDITNGTGAYEIYIAGGGTLSEVDFNAAITDIPTHIEDATKHIDTTTAELSDTIDETNDKFTIWDNSLLKWIRFSFTSLKTYLNGIYHKFGGFSFGAKQIIGSTDNQDFGIVTNNIERVTVLKDGNVGIGTTNPAQKLQVASDGVYFQSLSGQVYISGETTPGKRLMLGYDTTNNFGFIEGINFGISYSPIILNPYAGNVGIGTTAPNSKLKVAGGIQCGDDTYAASADKVGTTRYRATANASYVEMCMQIGASSYSWVAIVTNTW